MYYIYALKSIRNGKRYVGQTSKDPEIRLNEHNSGLSKFTKHNRPFILVYTESFENRTEAIKRENFLKSGVGRKFLDSKISNIGPLA